MYVLIASSFWGFYGENKGIWIKYYVELNHSKDLKCVFASIIEHKWKQK